eukprot:Skav229630  [mRNA]  locus=scaffold649:157411:158118:- [translate_table: standard]
MEDKAPWKCRFCKKMRSYSAEFCQTCGQGWRRCADPSFVYNPPQQNPQQPPSWSANTWYSRQWPEGQTPWVNNDQMGRQASPSPRRQQAPRPKTPKSPRNNQSNKGKDGSQSKGKAGKGKGKGKPVPPPPPEHVPAAELSWMPPSHPSPSEPPAPVPAINPEMQELMGKLRSQSSQLLEQLVQSMSVRTSQQATKDLHNAVSRLGAAKKQLQETIQARTTLHRHWQGYVNDSIRR